MHNIISNEKSQGPSFPFKPWNKYTWMNTYTCTCICIDCTFAMCSSHLPKDTNINSMGEVSKKVLCGLSVAKVNTNNTTIYMYSAHLHAHIHINRSCSHIYTQLCACKTCTIHSYTCTFKNICSHMHVWIVLCQLLLAYMYNFIIMHHFLSPPPPNFLFI